MSAVTRRMDAERRLTWHRDQCDTCKAGKRCGERWQLAREADAAWLGQIASYSTGSGL